MQSIGMVGLGRMGGNMSRRIARAGLEVIAWDRAAGARAGSRARHGSRSSRRSKRSCRRSSHRASSG